MREIDELEFPETRPHAEMLRLAADMVEEDDYVGALDVIDEVRAQLVEALLEKECPRSGGYILKRYNGN
jgi:hypothetical protein